MSECWAFECDDHDFPYSIYNTQDDVVDAWKLAVVDAWMDLAID